MNLLNRLLRRSHFPEANHAIIKAFTCGGVDYFQFDDVFNVPYRRGLGAIKYYEEFRMRTTAEFLKLHYESVKAILTPEKGKGLDITKIAQLNEQLGERLNWALDGDSLYNFASVVFFDATESPFDYEMKYNKRKIAEWKKHMEAKDFFLQQPLIRLIPYLRDLNASIPDYLEVTAKVTQFHLENLLGAISDESKRSSLKKSYGFAEALPVE